MGGRRGARCGTKVLSRQTSYESMLGHCDQRSRSAATATSISRLVVGSATVCRLGLHSFLRGESGPACEWRGSVADLVRSDATGSARSCPPLPPRHIDGNSTSLVSLILTQRQLCPRPRAPVEISPHSERSCDQNVTSGFVLRDRKSEMYFVFVSESRLLDR